MLTVRGLVNASGLDFTLLMFRTAEQLSKYWHNSRFAKIENSHGARGDQSFVAIRKT